MMKETNIHSQVTSTIAGDDGEAMAKSEGYVAENGFVATDPTHFGKTYHDKQSRYTCCPWGCFLTTFVFVRVEDKNLNEIRFRSDVYKMLSERGKSAPYAIPDTKFDNFSEREFEEKVSPILGHSVHFCQDNESMSSYGVMRGLHFQCHLTHKAIWYAA